MIESVVDDAIVTLDAGGRVASWNSGAERITGYVSDEIVGRHFPTSTPRRTQLRAHPPNSWGTARWQGHLRDEGWRVRKDGTRFWADVVITALHDLDGALCGYCAVTRDVTQRRDREQRLAEMSERRLRAVTDSMGKALCTLDHAGRVSYINPAGEQLEAVRAVHVALVEGRFELFAQPIIDLRTGRPVRTSCCCGCVSATERSARPAPLAATLENPALIAQRRPDSEPEDPVSARGQVSEVIDQAPRARSRRGSDSATQRGERAYADAVRAGDPHAAAIAIQDAAAGGLSTVRIQSRVSAPAMRAIGELWERGAMTIAQEHLATAVSHQVLAQLHAGLLGPAQRRGDAVGRRRGSWRASRAWPADGCRRVRRSRI